jgi:hypothetical protein
VEGGSIVGEHLTVSIADLTAHRLKLSLTDEVVGTFLQVVVATQRLELYQPPGQQ